MRREDVAVVLALFQGNWSREYRMELTDQQVAVWVDHLRDIEAGPGLATARELIATTDHFPTVSEFRAAWRVHIRREGRGGALPAAERQPASKDVGLAGIKLARVALADARPIQVRSKE